MRIILSLFTLFLSTAFSQSVIDSLEKNLSTAIGENRIEILIRLGSNLSDAKPRQTLLYGKEALKLSEGIADATKMIRALLVISDSYSNLGLNQESLDASLNAKEISLKLQDKQLIARTTQKVGSKLYLLEHYEECLNHLHRSLELSKEIDFQDGIIESYFSLALMYRTLGQLDKYNDYVDKAANLTQGIKLRRYELQTIKNKAYQAYTLEKYDSAINQYLMALQIYEWDGKVSAGKLGILFSLGNCFRKKMKYNTAIDYYEKAIYLAKDVGDINIIAASNRYIGLIYHQKKDMANGVSYYRKALQYADSSVRLRGLPDIYKGLAAIYEELGDYKSAHEFSKKYASLRDTLFQEERKLRLKGVENKFQNELSINKINELEFGRQKILTNVSLIIALITLIAITIIIYYAFNRAKSSKKILLQKEELESLNFRLGESEARYRNLFQNSPVGIYRITPSGEIILANRTLIEMLGYDSLEEWKDCENKGVDTIFTSGLREKYLAQLEAKSVLLGYESTWINNKNKILHLLENSFRIKDEEGKTIFYEGTAQDITERKKASEALRRSDENLRKFFELPLVGHGILNRKMEWVDYNDHFCSIFGYSREEIKSVRWRAVTLPEDFPKEAKIFREMLTFDKNVFFEKKAIRKDGTLIDLEISAGSIKNSLGEVQNIFIQINDITVRKESERIIEKSLKEKEVLLKEIHHRVKNNLQVISSLLNLQANTITDKAVLEVFQESQNRIRTMALIHEKLYKTNNFKEIDLNAYVLSLTEFLFRTYSTNKYLINLNLKISDVSFPIDKAIPCGLILNEIISNSLKYAFPAGRTGNISVEVCESEKNGLMLIVSDDGVGLPKGIEVDKLESLGMQLIAILASQLDATMSLDSENGTKYTFVFEK